MIATETTTRLRKTLRQTADLVRFVARRQVTGRLHVKQFERLESQLVESLTVFFKEQANDISKRLALLVDDPGIGKSVEDQADALLQQAYNPNEWLSPLVDASLPWLANAMARAMLSQAAIILDLPTGFDEGENESKATTATIWLTDHPNDAAELTDTMRRTGVPVKPFSELPERYQKRITDSLNTTFKQPYWREINKTTGGEANRVLQKGLLEGRSIRAMSKDMRESLGGDRRARIRATAIARTEGANALNSARKDATNQLVSDLGGQEKMPVQSAWLSVLANTTRAEHAALDGVVEDGNGMWNLAGQLIPWPAHYTLAVAQRVNCFCTSVIDFIDEKEARTTVAQALIGVGTLNALQAISDFGRALIAADAEGLPKPDIVGAIQAVISSVVSGVVRRIPVSNVGSLRILPFIDEIDVSKVIDDEALLLKSRVDGSKKLRRAVDGYTTIESGIINDTLRSGKLSGASRSIRKNVVELDKITKTPFAQEVTVYRGVGEASEEFLADATRALQSGEFVVDKGFVSTSLNPGTSANFSKKDVFLQIRTKRGAVIYKAGEDSQQLEVLLPRGTKFKVEGIDKNVRIRGKSGSVTDREFTVIRMAEQDAAKDAASTIADIGDNRTILARDKRNVPVFVDKRASEIQREAVKNRQLKDSVVDYATDSRPFNDALRAGRMPSRSVFVMEDGTVSLSKLQKMTELNRIAHRPLPRDLTVYRGIRNDPKFLKSAERTLREGGEITDLGFTSTSIDPDLALVVSGVDDPVMLQISTKVGAPLYKVEEELFGSMGEVLLPTKSRFKVLGIDRNVSVGGAPRTTVVRMERVD